MNDNSLKLPKFKYHPNVYDKEKVLDAVQFDNNVCQCCGNKTDVYVSMFLARRILVGMLR